MPPEDWTPLDIASNPNYRVIWLGDNDYSTINAEFTLYEESKNLKEDVKQLTD